MMPTMSSMTLLWTMVLNRKISPITAIAPTKAAARTAIKPVMLTEPTESEPPRPSITNATPTPAPLLIPKMLGPANGLLKAVCNIRPLTASEPPQSMAVIACGSRLSIMIYCQEGRAASCPITMLTTSRSGMDTDPTARLTANNTTINNANKQQRITPRFIISITDNR